MTAPPLAIALDASYGEGAELSGVGVYTRELLAALSRLDEARDAEWTWCWRPHHWRRVLLRRGETPSRVRRRFLWETRAVPGCRLFHGLGQRLTAAYEAPRTTCTVATFHDLFVMTQDYATRQFRARFTAQAREAARRADAIIAVSNFTAGQVEDLLGVERARLHVVPHGVRPLAMPAAGPTVAREPIVLSVGALQLRKNTLALIGAFERLPERFHAAGWRLVLTGSSGFGYESAIAPAIARSPRRARIEETGWVDDAALARLYARASVFAFPSLDEGFGIPALEAMAAGVPVLAANTSSLPEVCGDAALFVNPRHEEAIADGIARLIDDTRLRATLIDRGRRRAAEFTWDRCARETWAVYRSLLRS